MKSPSSGAPDQAVSTALDDGRSTEPLTGVHNCAPLDIRERIKLQVVLKLLTDIVRPGLPRRHVRGRHQVDLHKVLLEPAQHHRLVKI